ncbi:QoxB, Quinol oxidase subunit II [Agaricicola taiwanensis]|uniref:cytochrome-c oxidase n=1 Tax=Agaricicola taiwanensis TaxID=591372 RepID=A0A8J3DZ59_9RHOB|nr:cytochrome c oxidase subunit II [Agaricicola taiwanensis]GGE50750.1 QoxB, Quinol oxidase subunit II [Agaricicola taiwanensis]
MLPAAAMGGGCSGPLSTLDPAGPNAVSVAHLWWMMLAGAAAILALVIILFLVAFVRRDERGPVRERLWIGVGGFAFPVVVLSVLLVYALLRGEELLPRGSAPGAITIDAVSRQFSWEFRTGGRLESSGRLIIPTGRAVDVRVTSEDVIHSFWIPRLGGKIDAIPGHVNVVRLTADVPGIYRGQCAEYCGTGHSGMSFEVEALEPAAYDRRMAGAAP